MKNWLLTLVMSIAMIGTSGCLEEKNEYYVNPDGSGKVIRQVFSVEGGGLSLAGNDTSPEQQLQKMVQNALQTPVGIETWSDITADITDDGKLHFKGTAYFKDITKVSFETEDIETKTGFVISRAPDGSFVLELKEDEEKEKDEASRNLTPEQIQQQMKEQRLKYNQSKPIMMSFMQNFRQTTIVHYKGKLKRSVNFQKGDGTLTLSLDGSKLIEYMDDLMSDDNKLEQMIRNGDTLEDDSMNGFFEYLGGQPAPPVAVIEPTEQIFDYAKEVARAKANYADMVKSLSLNEAATVEIETVDYEPGMDIRNLRIGGVRIVYFEDNDINYRPFFQSKGYYFSLTGQMPVKDLQIEEGKLTKALTLDGEDLLPKKSFHQSINNPELADNGISISFNVQMNLPENDFSGLSEVAGSFKCFKSDRTKNIDLGLMDIKKGAVNEKEGISINQACKAQWGDGFEVELKMNILKPLLKDIQLFTEDGRQIKTDMSGGMSSGGYWLQRGFRTKEVLPEKGRIIIVLYDNLQECDIPFSLKNISLAGKPLDK